MGYGYIQSEAGDGFDYSFYSPQSGRLYTVSFEMSLYVDYADKFPTLVKNGYGFLFKFTNAREFDEDEPKLNNDPRVKETIAEIVYDFLSQQPSTCFVVYECHGYKHGKLFSSWYSEYNDGHVKKDGLTLSVDEKEYNDIHFGFMTTDKNPLFGTAQQEMQDFAVSLMF